jgi:lipopolysaccharide export system protein LptA
MSFTIDKKESILNHVSAMGHGVVNSQPIAVPGKEIGESHTLRSDNLEMKMRPGGHEMESVVTHAPGTLEFLPNLPSQHHRTLNGNNMVIAYGAQNRIENFRATDVKTLTDPTADEKKRNRVTSTTASRDLVARFDPKTSKLSTMEQSGAFVYQEGDRNAHAAKATLDNDVIVLDTGARMWDASGSTSADRIRMDQRTGDFTADGNVNSSRMPDQDPKKNSQMLSGDQPLQAQAHHMVSTDRNRKLHYEGSVIMWQGANRLTADKVDLDRTTTGKRGLIADGHVVNNLWETPKDDSKSGKPDAKAAPKAEVAKTDSTNKKTGPVLTVVKAPHLVYTDDNRLAYYTGGVDLTRPAMHVTGKELRAFLADSGADSRLEKAFVDGDAVIVDTEKGRTRTATADHGEFYTDENKVFLKSDKPKVAKLVIVSPRSTGSMMEGPQLTYYANDGRLLGSGATNQQVMNEFHKKTR